MDSFSTMLLKVAVGIVRSNDLTVSGKTIDITPEESSDVTN
jgi:hypothetical protein